MKSPGSSTKSSGRSTPEIPRGIRNNNPCNVKSSEHYVWRHQTGKDGGGFCIFDNAVWGMRAGCIIWQHYHDYHGCLDLIDYVDRWVGEDPKQALPYSRFLALQIGVNQFTPINIHAVAFPLLQGVVIFENGECPYPDYLLYRAITLSHEH